MRVKVKRLSQIIVIAFPISAVNRNVQSFFNHTFVSIDRVLLICPSWEIRCGT